MSRRENHKLVQIDWDHSVHYVNDLDAAIETFSSNQLVAFQGGSHKQWGTYNALSYFDLCYIEFLSIEDHQLIEQVNVPNDVVKDAVKYLPEQEALSRVALRTDDIEATAHRLDRYDVTHSPIMNGKRLDAQGHVIEWKMMTIPGEFQGISYPFVIEWQENDQKRRKQLKDTGAIVAHPIGDISISGAVFEVEHPIDVATHWSDIFGLHLIKKQKEEAIISIQDRSFIFRKGDKNQFTSIEFLLNDQLDQPKTFQIGEGNYHIY